MLSPPDSLPGVLGLLIAFAVTVAGFVLWASGWPGGDDR